MDFLKSYTIDKKRIAAREKAVSPFYGGKTV